MQTHLDGKTKQNENKKGEEKLLEKYQHLNHQRLKDLH